MVLYLTTHATVHQTAVESLACYILTLLNSLLHAHGIAFLLHVHVHGLEPGFEVQGAYDAQVHHSSYRRSTRTRSPVASPQLHSTTRTPGVDEHLRVQS